MYPIKLVLKRLVCLCFLPVNVNIKRLNQVLSEIEAKRSTKILCIDTNYKYLSRAPELWSSKKFIYEWVFKGGAYTDKLST